MSRWHAGITWRCMCSDAGPTLRRARMWSAATLKGRTDRCCRGPVDDESSKSNGVQRDGERWKRCEIKIQWAFKNKVWGRTRMGWEGRWVRKVKGNSATNTVYGCLWSPRILRCLDSNVDRSQLGPLARKTFQGYIRQTQSGVAQLVNKQTVKVIITFHISLFKECEEGKMLNYF